AAVLGLMISLLELGSRISFGVQIVQHRDGDSERFQNTSHKLQFLAGAGSTILMLLLCYPFALFFGIPQTTWAFALLSLVPLCRGVEHLDMARYRRRLNFGPSVACEAVP